MEDRRSRHSREWGTLYVVSTPIGNLEDITFRALNVLKSVGTVAAENVTHTRRIWARYGIKTRLAKYNQHNQKAKAPALIKRLKAGQDVAIVTDAGTPGVSDPGGYLIHMAAQAGIIVSPVPGPSAVMAALSVSGLPTEQFLFMGFLPNRTGKRRRVLTELVSQTHPLVFFEAPHRLKAMLADVRGVLGDRHMVMLREMTKAYEEVKRGAISEILASLTPAGVKGEITLVVAGAEKETRPAVWRKDMLDRMEGLLTENKMSVKDIAALLSREEGVAYRPVYRECLARKKAIERRERHGAG